MNTKNVTNVIVNTNRVASAQKVKECCELQISKINMTNLKITEKIFLGEENKLLNQIIADYNIDNNTLLSKSKTQY